MTATGQGAGKFSSILCKLAELTVGTVIAETIAVEYRADRRRRKNERPHRRRYENEVQQQRTGFQHNSIIGNHRCHGDGHLARGRRNR